jgi:hypothetical protein
VYVLRQNCRAAGWRWDTKKKDNEKALMFCLEIKLELNVLKSV